MLDEYPNYQIWFLLRFAGPPKGNQLTGFYVYIGWKEAVQRFGAELEGKADILFVCVFLS